MSKQIIVTISPTGQTMTQVVGVKGKACIKATEGLDDALGKKTSSKATSEMHEQPQPQKATAHA